jgi:hypothetical protein
MLLTELDGHPIFRRSPTAMFSSNITTAIQNELLARGIPALSGPTGGENYSWDQSVDIIPMDMNDKGVGFRPNGWGRDHQRFGTDWLHGDLKDMAFFYNRTSQ